MISLEQERKIIEFRALSWSLEKIAKEVGVSKPTVIKINKKYAARIIKLKELELDELTEASYLSKAKKVGLVGTRLQSIREVLVNRDLNALSTKELTLLEERYYKMGSDILS
jgi:hypothetical protein